MQPITIHDPRIAEFLRYWHESGRATYEASWDRAAARYADTPGWARTRYDEDFHETRTAKDRKKYIALDRGTSGVYLLDKATGRVWAVAGYGVRHSFRHFGTLDEMLAKWKAEFGELPPLPPAPANPFAAPPAPPLPTLEELTEALLEAKAAALAAAPGDDDGTCNLDTAILRLPGLRASVVEAAAGAAGIEVSKENWLGGPCWFLFLDYQGQANMRSRMAHAAYKALKARGLDAGEWLQMD